MEYIIVGLLILILICIIILLIKSGSKTPIVEKLGRFETDITKEIGNFKVDFSHDLRDDFDKLNERIENKTIDD